MILTFSNFNVFIRMYHKILNILTIFALKVSLLKLYLYGLVLFPLCIPICCIVHTTRSTW